MFASCRDFLFSDTTVNNYKEYYIDITRSASAGCRTKWKCENHAGISSIHQSRAEILIFQTNHHSSLMSHQIFTGICDLIAWDWKSVLARQELKKTFNKTLNKHKKNFWLRIFEFVKLQYNKMKQQGRLYWKTETDMSDVKVNQLLYIAAILKY